MGSISEGDSVGSISFSKSSVSSEGVSKKGTLFETDLGEKRVKQVRKQDRDPLAQQSAQIARVRTKTVADAEAKKIVARFKEACVQWKQGGSDETRLFLKQIGKSIKSQQHLLTEEDRQLLRSQYHVLRTRGERVWAALRSFARSVFKIRNDLAALAGENGMAKEELLLDTLQVANDLVKWSEQGRDKAEESDAEFTDKWEHFFDCYDQLIQLGPYDPAIGKAQQKYNELYDLS